MLGGMALFELDDRSFFLDFCLPRCRMFGMRCEQTVGGIYVSRET